MCFCVHDRPIPVCSICSAGSLIDVDLDGLCTNDQCPHRRGLSRNKFFQFLFGDRDRKNNFYFIHFIETDHVLECLLALPNITSLYFAGNGIHAELPELPEDSKLRYEAVAVSACPTVLSERGLIVCCVHFYAV